jgi:hypothetical protein
MNTKSKHERKNKGQMTRQSHGSKKGGQRPAMQQEHEHPEMRMTR